MARNATCCFLCMFNKYPDEDVCCKGDQCTKELEEKCVRCARCNKFVLYEIPESEEG